MPPPRDQAILFTVICTELEVAKKDHVLGLHSGYGRQNNLVVPVSCILFSLMILRTNIKD